MEEQYYKKVKTPTGGFTYQPVTPPENIKIKNLEYFSKKQNECSHDYVTYKQCCYCGHFEKPPTMGQYVLRATYQKVAEDNKKLLADIKILTTSGISPARILLIEKWQNKFKEDNNLNDLITEACNKYAKDNPQYVIKPISEEGKRQSIINARNLPIKKNKIMNNEFSKTDLVSFGNYLLSQEREQRFQDNPNFPNQEGLGKRLKEVHHSDIENWINNRKTPTTSIKYFILSKLHKHASGVLNETDTTITIQKVKAVDRISEFSSQIETDIIPDDDYLATVELKNDLLKVFPDVELTTNHWIALEFLTGRKRKSISQNTES